MYIYLFFSTIFIPFYEIFIITIVINKKIINKHIIFIINIFEKIIIKYHNMIIDFFDLKSLNK